MHDSTPQQDRVYDIERPSPRLLTQYLLTSFLAGPGFPVLLAVLFVRYRTLRYKFDDEGISWSRGMLFRKEIHLTYSRIQDIHLTSNLVERYLGLARIQIQTASGISGAEVTIEGLEEHELVRDFIYARMRGARATARGREGEGVVTVAKDSLADALSEAASALRDVRELLERQAADGGTSS